MNNKNILIILPAKDFNSEEFILTKQIFEKSGFKVFISSDAYGLCQGDNGIKVKADVSIFNIHASNFLAAIFIGGNGVRKYWENKSYHNIANIFAQAGKVVAAICAAPIILQRAGLLDNKNATCYSADRKELEKGSSRYLDTSVVVEDKIVTGQSYLAAVEFANAVIQVIKERGVS